MTDNYTDGVERERCYKCMGLGEIKSETWDVSWPCSNCEGNGHISTLITETKQ